MYNLSRAHFEEQVAEYDQQVAATRGIDQFCSSSAWILAAHDAFTPKHDLSFWRGDHGYLCLSRHTTSDGLSLWQPCESTWYLGCPMIGADPHMLAAEVCHTLLSQHKAWDICIISGIDLGSSLLGGLSRKLARRCTLSLGPISRRRLASLAGGYAGWLSRRSRQFRRNLRRARERGQTARLSFEAAHPRSRVEALCSYARIQAIEANSWKGRQAVGINIDPMRSFYENMLIRLASTASAHLIFARHEERDVGYILGALWGNSYRGLQFAYDQSLASVSLGNLMQQHVIAAMAESGCDSYDLGVDIAYKHSWGETRHDTLMVILHA